MGFVSLCTHGLLVGTWALRVLSLGGWRLAPCAVAIVGTRPRCVEGGGSVVGWCSALSAGLPWLRLVKQLMRGLMLGAPLRQETLLRVSCEYDAGVAARKHGPGPRVLKWKGKQLDRRRHGARGRTAHIDNWIGNTNPAWACAYRATARRTE